LYIHLPADQAQRQFTPAVDKDVLKIIEEMNCELLDSADFDEIEAFLENEHYASIRDGDSVEQEEEPDTGQSDCPLDILYGDDEEWDLTTDQDDQSGVQLNGPDPACPASEDIQSPATAKRPLPEDLHLSSRASGSESFTAQLDDALRPDDSPLTDMPHTLALAGEAPSGLWELWDCPEEEVDERTIADRECPDISPDPVESLQGNVGVLQQLLAEPSVLWFNCLGVDFAISDLVRGAVVNLTNRLPEFPLRSGDKDSRSTWKKVARA
jgi:hypothetical protein